MAIIKIDKQAWKQLQVLVSMMNQDPEMNFCSNLKLAAKTSAFKLLVEQVGEMQVTFRLHFGAMCQGGEMKSLSVAVEVAHPNEEDLKRPFIVTIFLKNLKMQDGKSFKKVMKMTPSGFLVERLLRNFISMEELSDVFDENSMIHFGIHIRQST